MSRGARLAPTFIRCPAPKSARPRACWSPTSASTPPRPWCAFAPTPMPPAEPPPKSRATFSTGGSHWRLTNARPTQPRTESEMTETPRETRELDAVASLLDSLLADFHVVGRRPEQTTRCPQLRQN